MTDAELDALYDRMYELAAEVGRNPCVELFEAFGAVSGQIANELDRRVGIHA